MSCFLHEMDILKKYAIAHKGLGVGNHSFEFDIDDQFFGAFEQSEIRKGKAVVKINLDKQSNMLTLGFVIEGKVTVECDRCLDEFDMPFVYEGTLYVRYSETEKESDGEVMWVSPNETEIGLAQYIYESICLSLPYQRIHPEDENGRSLCNPDMLSRFQIVTEEEFERMTQGKDETSPWNRLEDLKKKLENK